MYDPVPMRRVARSILLAAGWMYSILHFWATGVRQSLAIFSSDFLAAFPAHRAAALAGRLDMHYGSLAESWEGHADPLWHYGPVLHLITAPLFAFRTLREAFTFWLFVNFVFVAATLWLLVNVLDEWRPTFTTTSIVVFALFNFNPFYEALSIRAIEIFELLLVVAAFALYMRGRHVAAGVSIGVAAMTKFLPLIYLPYFALRRNWRALGAAVAAIVPIAVATQFVLGWQHSGMIRQLAAPRGSIIAFEENQSLAGAVLRLVSWTHSSIDEVLAARISIVLGLVALSILFVRIRRSEGIGDLQWWMLAVAMVLLPPHNQNYYLVFLLPAYLVVFFRYRRGALLASFRAVLLYVSFLIVALPVPLSMVSRIVGTPVWPLYLRSGLAFAGAALLAALIAAEMLRKAPPSVGRRPILVTSVEDGCSRPCNADHH